MLKISLSDTGIGISEDNLGIIFEEFKQASGPGRDPRSGAGLGLAILSSTALADEWAHLGGKHCRSGSTFYVLVPLYAQQDQREDQPEEQAAQLVMSK